MTPMVPPELVSIVFRHVADATTGALRGRYVLEVLTRPLPAEAFPSRPFHLTKEQEFYSACALTQSCHHQHPA